MKKYGTRILHVITTEVKVIDIPRTLDELGYDVYTANIGMHATGFYKRESWKILMAIENFKIECVTSYCFSETIAVACMEAGVPYIAWVYDAPQKELYTHYALYPCNYIFVFDKMQLQRMKDIGIKNVYFMPLAIHGEKIRRELGTSSPSDLCDVAFVGSIYYVEGTEKVVEIAPDHIRNEINDCIDKCFMQWGDDNMIHGRMSEECAAYFDSLEAIAVEKRYPYIKKEFYYEAAVLARMLAYRERVYILNTLAEKYDVRFYTFDKHTEDLNDKVKIYPGIKYDGGISCVYRDAKININNTLHCIETGACQRIFEVMAAGGFLISNYQKELEELFVPGKEIVLYHNEEELLQLVDYYLTHEKEREEIARNGQRKVLANYEFHKKFESVMNIVYEKEKHRREHYYENQKKELIMYTNQALNSGEKEKMQELYALYCDSPFDLVIQKENNLSSVKEMLYVWNEEQVMGFGNIFEDVHNIDEAERKYLRTKHILWRIENDFADDVCRIGVQELINLKISSVFLAWHIKANLSERKKIYLKLSDYFSEISISRGLEFITYGLLEFPGDKDMLMHKANYLLEVQSFMEALDTLKSIENPDDDVVEIIQELETALEIV